MRLFLHALMIVSLGFMTGCVKKEGGDGKKASKSQVSKKCPKCKCMCTKCKCPSCPCSKCKSSKRAELDLPEFDLGEDFDSDEFDLAMLDESDSSANLAENEADLSEDWIMSENELNEMDDDLLALWDNDSDSAIAENDEALEMEEDLEPVYFNINKASISQDQKDIVSSNIEKVRDAVDKGHKVLIQGYGCALGDKNYNMKLSERRAKAIEKEMLQAGIPADAIQTVACGQDDPVVSSDSTDKSEIINDLALNRRTEITIM